MTPAVAVPPAAWLVAVALGIVYVVWGSTYLGIAIAVQTIPPFVMAGVRFLVAGLILLAWSRLRDGRAFVPPTRREWRDSAIVGGLLLGGGMGLVAWGEQTIPSGIAALMVALVPVWIAIFGRVAYAQRLPGLAIAGIAIGFGAQQLIRDFLAGIFITIEDQYGIGDIIETSEVVGTVEAMNLRITRVRADDGTIWYLRNGEILRVGNRSQGTYIPPEEPAAEEADSTTQQKAGE